MARSDKLLAGIVAGILLLVVLAVAVVLLRPEEEYRPDDLPENIVFNYLLALQREDYERAYGYLSPSIENYPRSLTAFERDLDRYGLTQWQEQSNSLSVIGAEVDSMRAKVEVVELSFYGGSLFGGSQTRNTFTVQLERRGNAWRITDSPYYFAYCWTGAVNCR